MSFIKLQELVLIFVFVTADAKDFTDSIKHFLFLILIEFLRVSRLSNAVMKASFDVGIFYQILILPVCHHYLLIQRVSIQIVIFDQMEPRLR